MKKRTWIAGGVVVASVAMAVLLANETYDSTAFVVLALIAHAVVAVVGLRLARRWRADRSAAKSSGGTAPAETAPAQPAPQPEKSGRVG
ncbi:hypothetical protein [Streptomyces lonarensis]|uniref:Uncharacterized protein n=1 Tax=Streptomyces lonarensis TaxID=700599 RepID=A0A7X6CZ36_9ACTN|nr:hypothetical protein [Streptomyces lonarensis]NJQ05110.1 hypothetical protein [Streptomyces lonarensis]